ncbi:uncharacterized protein BDV17DRAFT_274426 [Aspergillus undulatus]|uniref:uncharacterized protein n=1 Tax=Aspergillus undulatus TaxID=1810928 RepID=UPI003CCCCE1A
MGVKATGGAIEQHLKKLHTRRVQAKKPVPPAPTRGSGGETETPQKASGGGSKKPRINDSPSSDEEWVEGKVLTRRRAGLKRKLPQPRYTEIPDVDYEYEFESYSSDSEMVASGAAFLELPNDKHQEASRSSRSSRSRTPSTPTKMISYKCPKDFLAGLNSKTHGNSSGSRNITNQGSALKLELPSETKPVVKVERLQPAIKPEPVELSRAVYGSLPQESSSLPMDYNNQSNLVGTAALLDRAPTVGFPAHTQPPLQGGTMYIPTGNPATDLPPIGDIFSSDSITSNDSLPPLQGFEMDQSFVADQGFQDMLEEYFIPPGDADWYSGQLAINNEI